MSLAVSLSAPCSALGQDDRTADRSTAQELLRSQVRSRQLVQSTYTHMSCELFSCDVTCVYCNSVTVYTLDRVSRQVNGTVWYDQCGMCAHESETE